MARTFWVRAINVLKTLVAGTGVEPVTFGL